jgi:Domain of unknown function (DUF4118)
VERTILHCVHVLRERWPKIKYVYLTPVGQARPTRAKRSGVLVANGKQPRPSSPPQGELVLSLVAATSTALSFDYFFTVPYGQFAIRGAQGVVTVVTLIAAVPALGTWLGRLYGKEAARERELRDKAERYAEELAERRRQVEQLAAELAASRRRILAVGDQMRRQIERDLHDGAQQRLVTLSLTFIRTGSGACPSRCEPTERCVPAEGWRGWHRRRAPPGAQDAGPPQRHPGPPGVAGAGTHIIPAGCQAGTPAGR